MKKVVVIGLDGLDPVLTEALLSAGELPNLARLRSQGSYHRLATTSPAQTPVAWSSFATGSNPGAHGIFDFLRRDAATYQPEVSLYAYERPSRFLPPRPVSQRGGTALWDVLGSAGIPSVVLRHPCTFPPSKPPRGRILAGVGVPDLRGSFGTATVYTSASAPRDASTVEAEVVVGLEPEAGVVRTHVPGPLVRGGELTTEVALRFDGSAGTVRVEAESGSEAVEVAEGEWSDWLRVRFRAGPLQTIRGRLRFHLVRSSEPYLLYASPVNYDPEVPHHPISEPWDYAWELDRALSGYHTLGMAEDHSGLNNGRLSEEAYLAQCEDVRRERLAMMHHELARHEEGLFYCLFDTPDRVQHMFWRYREEGHPANRDHPVDPAMAGALESEYRACDDAVGQALAYADADTLFLVASDHGFTSFQRQLHLNRWLHDHGFLALRDGVDPEEGPGLEEVDWSRTRAYAVGLVGVYLNLAGREGQGVVSADEAPEVAGAIRGQLTGLLDPERGTQAIRRVEPREEVYRGEYMEEAPDLVVQCAPGYRVSSATALGAVRGAVLEDNRKRWSGDHVVDPSAVPGILFSNRALAATSPGITDLAPTILRALGAPAPESWEGESLLS